jgi:tetratricopeptide (TPR) repeat protein
MIGKFDTGLFIYQKAMTRYKNRDKDYHAMYLGALDLVYWVDADLIALEQTADCLMELIKEDSLPAAVSFGLHYLGIIQYHRNELQNAEETLTQSSETHYAYSPMNFAHSTFALALRYQAQGKPDQARKISRSVVHDAIETNNADVLQVARAFEAELALRQGHLTTVSRWLKKYQAKPFVPPFRFYMPQLTAGKILLAQNPTDSQRQAADLLEQLHDYLESIHNNRFRIDVLALQALLHGTRGKESAVPDQRYCRQAVHCTEYGKKTPEQYLSET